MSAVKVPPVRDVAGPVVFVQLCFGVSFLGGTVANAAFSEW